MSGGECSCVVLGGGGVAGIAWMTGLLYGLAEQNVDLRAASRVIGTSAGAVVGAQLLSGVPLEKLYLRQTDPQNQVPEISPAPQSLQNAGRVMAGLRRCRGPLQRKRCADEAARLSCISSDERRAVIAARLPTRNWPAKPLSITAVDLDAGVLRVFDAASGIDLVTAVAASCALPGLWPPVAFEGRRYVDGGVRSAENADLANGARHVVILSPNGLGSKTGQSDLERERDLLKTAGASVVVIEPNSNARQAIGANMLDPSVRGAAALAGRLQGSDGLLSNLISKG